MKISGISGHLFFITNHQSIEIIMTLHSSEPHKMLIQYKQLYQGKVTKNMIKNHAFHFLFALEWMNTRNKPELNLMVQKKTELNLKKLDVQAPKDM